MKEPSPLSLAELAGAGTAVIVTVVAGLLAGLGAATYLHWQWAVPLGVIVGFAAGLAAMFRRLSKLM